MKTERRVSSNTEMRISSGGREIVGYAAVFNKWSEDLGFFREKIKPGAFSKSLSDGADVRALINHDPNLILGRVSNGTLELEEDDIGLKYRIKLPSTSYANDLKESVRRGDITQNSFGFLTIRDSWKQGDGKELDERTLIEAKLLDISPVTFPAYPQTSLDLRQKNNRKDFISMDQLNELRMSLKRAQTEIDEIMKDDSGEERQKISKADSRRVKELIGAQKDIAEQIDTYQEYRKSDELLREPVERPVCNIEPDATIAHREGRIFGSLGEQLRSIVESSKQGGRIDPRLNEVTRAATGLNETIPSQGGFLLEDTFTNNIISNIYKTGIIASRCRKYPVGANSNSITIPGVDENSRKDGYRQGGILTYNLEEATAISSSRPTFRQVKMELGKKCALVYLTDEILSDSTLLESFVTRAVTEEMGFMLDAEVIAGNGVGSEFLGILSSSALVTQDKLVGQTAETIHAENIFQMYERYSGSLQSGVWCCHKSCLEQIMTMSIAVGTGGIPVYMPANQMAGRPYNSLLGMPIW